MVNQINGRRLPLRDLQAIGHGHDDGEVIQHVDAKLLVKAVKNLFRDFGLLRFGQG